MAKVNREWPEAENERRYWGEAMALQQAERQLAGRQEILRSVLLATVGTVLIAGLALAANWGHPPARIAIAVLGQMALCFVMTLTSATLMQVAFKLPRHPFLKFLAASAGVGLSSLALMTLVHWLIGTPEIFKTVASATAASVFYYVLFPLALLKEHLAERDRAYREATHWRCQWGLRRFPVPYGPADFGRVVWHNLFPPGKRYRELTPFTARQFRLKEVSQRPCRIAFLGDLMPMQSCSLAFDEALRDRIARADYLVANFEGSLGDGPWACLQQKHDEKILDALERLKPAERIYLSVAKNHAADFDYDQYLLTKARLRERGFQVFGSRDQPAALIDGLVCLVGATQWTNQRHGYLPFLEHAEHSLREGYCNILYPHWGYEMERYPRPDWISRAKALSETFDAVVGHHSHLPGPVTFYPDASGRETLVAYSLGDATTGLKLARYQHGMLLNLDICRVTRQVVAGDWQFVRTHITGRVATLKLHDTCPLFPELSGEEGGAVTEMPRRV